MTDAWAGGPEMEQAPYAQQWVQDVISTSKEQDIWRDLAVGMIDEIGAIKLIAIVMLFMLATVGGTLFGAYKLFRRGR